MKNIIILLITTILFSCTAENPKNQIKVGMTFDEVESIMDKPTSISRGFTEIERESPYLDNDKFMYAEVPKNKFKREYGYQKVSEKGQLIYTTWQYSDIKRDTFFIAYSDKQDKITTELFRVDSIYSILFDAASGRVASFGYYPESIIKIN